MGGLEPLLLAGQQLLDQVLRHVLSHFACALSVLCYRRIVEQSTTALEPVPESSSSATPEQEIRLRTVSVVDAAADALRQMVLDGTLEPGARLRETDFSKRLGIARHTFRAATQILINEGLLRRSPEPRRPARRPRRRRHRRHLPAPRGARDRGDPPRRSPARRRSRRPSARSSGSTGSATTPPGAPSSTSTWTSTGPSSTPPTASGSTAPTPACSRRSCSAWPSFAPTTTDPPRSPPSIVSCSRRSSSATSKVTEDLFRKHLGDATENLTNALEAREEVTA